MNYAHQNQNLWVSRVVTRVLLLSDVRDRQVSLLFDLLEFHDPKALDSTVSKGD